MSNEKFTKGEWFADGLVIDNPGFEICSLTVGAKDMDENIISDGELEANANLISAAPEMYEALKLAKGTLSTLLVMNGSKFETDDKIIIHEAILKAQESLSKANPQPITEG